MQSANKEKLKIKSQGIMISSCIYFPSHSNGWIVTLAAFIPLNPWVTECTVLKFQGSICATWISLQWAIFLWQSSQFFLTFLSDFLISFVYMQPIHLSKLIKLSLYLSHRKRGKNNISSKNTMSALSLSTLSQWLFSVYASHRTRWYCL